MADTLLDTLSQESAQRIARVIKAEIPNDTQYFVVLPPIGPVAFLAEFAPGDASSFFSTWRAISRLQKGGLRRTT